MACLSQDEMNQLELDNEFMKQMIGMPVYGTEENKEFIKDTEDRLKRRLYLATKIAKKAKLMSDYDSDRKKIQAAKQQELLK